jgi:hypothetical protein
VPEKISPESLSSITEQVLEAAGQRKLSGHSEGLADPEDEATNQLALVEQKMTDHPYHYKRFAILYVDDELISLKLTKLALQDHFRILTASGAEEGLAVLERHKDEIGVLMTDQRMPGGKMVCGYWKGHAASSPASSAC